jgi:Family of unknown function (DUF5995)
MSSVFDRNHPEYENQMGRPPTRKLEQRREHEERDQAHPQSNEREWEKSFHGMTTQGALKLNISRFKNGSLEGTYKLQGRSIQPLQGEVTTNVQDQRETVQLVDQFGAKWHGHFTDQNGEQLQFSQITLPGITDGHPVVKLQDVNLGSSETAQPATQEALQPSTPDQMQALKPEQQLEQPSIEPELESEASLETWQKNSSKKSWREAGKLRGNPPVRDEKNPPNKNIIEDEKTYKQLLSEVRRVLKEQHARAEALKDNKTGVVDDYRYWFTKVYSFVTENEIKFAEEQSYYYPTAVMLDVLYFDKVYEDNLNASKAKQEPHWKAAFESALLNQVGPDRLPTDVAEMVMSLVSGMLAHIRFDLPRSLAWVGDRYKQQFGASMEDLKPDFFSMSGVFDNATRDMFEVIKQNLSADKLGGFGVDTLQSRNWTSTAMRNLIGADMSAERLVAWQRAVALQRTGESTSDPYQLVNGQLQGNVTRGDYKPDWDDLPKNVQPGMEGIRYDLVGPYAQGLMGALEVTGIATLSEEIIFGWQLELEDPKKAASITTEQKAQMLLKLIEVQAPTPRTPKLIMTILESSQKKGDLELLMNMVDAFDLISMASMFGLENRDKIEIFLLANYYPKLVIMNSANQIAKWKESDFSRAENRTSAQRIFVAQDKTAQSRLSKLLFDEYKIKIRQFLG